jgi:NAD+--asparagine ADP-ribosyltransferase
MAAKEIDDYIQVLVGAFGDRLGKRAENVAKDILKYLDEGRSVDLAVDIALSKSRIRHYIRDEITDILITVTGIARGVSFEAISNKPDLVKFYLDRTWPDEKLTLSRKINKLQWKEEIKGVIKAGLHQGKEFQKIAEDVTDLNLNKGDISKKIPRLISSAESLLRSRGQSISDLREFKKNLAAFEGHVKTLSKTSVYQNLRAMGNTILDQAKALDTESLQKSLIQAVKDKARYNATRLAHTESRKAFTLQSVVAMDEDQDVVAYRYKLGNYQGHHTDVCDLYSKADLFGLGKGIYPKGLATPPPVHPWCRCQLIPVFGSEIKSGKFKESGITNYLDSLTESDRKDLLGAVGSQQYESNKDNWRFHLKGYEGPGYIKIGNIIQPKIDPALVKKFPLNKDLRPYAKP